MHCSVWRFTGDPEALERGYRKLPSHLRHVPLGAGVPRVLRLRPRARPLRGARSPGRRRGGLPARGGLRATQRGHGRDVGSASGARL